MEVLEQEIESYLEGFMCEVSCTKCSLGETSEKPFWNLVNMVTKTKQYY